MGQSPFSLDSVEFVPLPQTSPWDFDQGALRTPVPGLCCGTMLPQGTEYDLSVNPMFTDVPRGPRNLLLSPSMHDKACDKCPAKIKCTCLILAPNPEHLWNHFWTLFTSVKLTYVNSSYSLWDKSKITYNILNLPKLWTS